MYALSYIELIWFLIIMIVYDIVLFICMLSLDVFNLVCKFCKSFMNLMN